MRFWRMLVVNKEQGCLPWTVPVEMLGICLTASPSPITGLSLSQYIYNTYLHFHFDFNLFFIQCLELGLTDISSLNYFD